MDIQVIASAQIFFKSGQQFIFSPKIDMSDVEKGYSIEQMREKAIEAEEQLTNLFMGVHPSYSESFDRAMIRTEHHGTIRVRCDDVEFCWVSISIVEEE